MSAAFYNARREQLWKILEEKDIKESLIGRLKEIYEKTKATIRIREGLTRKFESVKGVRQGYMMSPVLFNLYMAIIDSELNI